MKWKTREDKIEERRIQTESLVGVPRKKFAFLPKRLTSFGQVWLEYYYAVYEKVPKNCTSNGYINEIYYAKEQQ